MVRCVGFLRGCQEMGSPRLPQTLSETNSLHLKMDWVGIHVSFWNGPFSGAILVSGSVEFFGFNMF